MHFAQWISGLEALGLSATLVIFAGALLSRGSAPFRAARIATGLAVVISLFFAAGLAFLSQGGLGPLPDGAFSSSELASSGLVQLDSVTAAMLLLVSGLGAVITHYSRTYLAGDPGQLRYARWLLATLSAVTALVTTGHLVVMAIAWTMTSVALHQLLTFYRERTAAQIAAHKKFLVSRLADVCLWSGFGLLFHATGTLRLDGLAEWVVGTGELPIAAHLAAVLFVVAACLKSAQLPFHGWLTQVMEAPTPVSALLHAGVVNLGGLLMIRLAPLMAKAALAQALLVLVAMTTVVLASMVVRTRVTAKGALAWSTCAQMGFMLVECGLGLWHLAMLHLVAHSFYKAHAFLSAGTTVERWRLDRMVPARTPSRSSAFVAATLTALALSALATGSIVGWGSFTPAMMALAAMVALATVPWLAEPTVRSVGATLALVALYAFVHVGAGWVWPSALVALTIPAELEVALAAAVGGGFVGLFCIVEVLERRPQGNVARQLVPWLFAGLHLDERFSRWTFRLWPPRLPAPTHPQARMPMEPLS